MQVLDWAFETSAVDSHCIVGWALSWYLGCINVYKEHFEHDAWFMGVQDVMSTLCR